MTMPDAKKPHRKKPKALAQVNMESMRLILDASIDGLLVIDGKGIVRFLNHAASELMARDAKEMVGEKFDFPVSVSAPAEVDLFRGEKGMLSAEMRVVDIEWEGAACKLVSLHDITDRKRAADADQKSREEMLKTLEGVVKAMSGLLVARDPYTAGHQLRVASLVKVIGAQLGLDADMLKGLYVASLIHDIGKISVPSEILSKPGKLSEIEFDFLKEHAQVGYDILKDIEFPWPVADAVLQHHERLDGSGYPQGLRGEDIILEARILAVADVSEAMLSHRPYRPALPMETLIEELKAGSGVHYDAKVVDACLTCFSQGFTFG